MKTIYFNNQTIVAFHIGRGGRFNNQGHVSFLGEHKISEYTGNLFAPMMASEDEDEEPIEDNAPEAEWTNCNGDSVGLTNEMVESGIGRIEEDGDYDTTYTMFLGDVEEDSDEWNAIFEADGFDAEQAQMFLSK